MGILARLTTEEIDITRVIAAVQDAGHGAIDTFIGIVRNHHNGKVVTGITYDAHAVLAEAALSTICGEAQKRWPETKYAVMHYSGSLPVGGTSIAIAVSAPHRAESFSACRYVIEEIKTRAPVWKQEHYADGRSDWLPGHSLCAGEEK